MTSSGINSLEVGTGLEGPSGGCLVVDVGHPINGTIPILVRSGSRGCAFQWGGVVGKVEGSL